jgi:MFS family permease
MTQIHRTSLRDWLALVALALAMLTVGLDMTVLNIALPTLSTDLHATTATLQWFTTAYTLTLSALMLPAGALGDRYGRKKMIVVALLVFGTASAACAMSTSSATLIAARVVLGGAAAVLTALSLSVIPVMFLPESRGRATTVFATATGLGMPLGPIVGGWLLQNFWWGSVFLINIPMTVLGGSRRPPGSRVAQHNATHRRPARCRSFVDGIGQSHLRIHPCGQ